MTQNQSHTSAEKAVLTTSEAARYLRVSRGTLHTYTQAGVIPHARIGSAVRYRVADLDGMFTSPEQVA